MFNASSANATAGAWTCRRATRSWDCRWWPRAAVPFWLGSHAHLLYRHGGRDLSLYVTPGETRPAETLGVLGHVERIWNANGQVYALVSGGRADAEFDRIATFLQHETATPQ